MNVSTQRPLQVSDSVIDSRPALELKTWAEEEWERDASTLAYGHQRRVEIARALATFPRLLLLDEPAAGLNPAETEGMSALIRRIAESGVTVLLVEHDMRLVMGVSQRVTVLDRGRRIADGTPAEIASDPAVVAAYLGTEDAA